MRTPFAVGRLTPTSARIVLLRGKEPPSLPDGRTLRALVHRLGSRGGSSGGSTPRSSVPEASTGPDGATVH